MEEDKLSKEIDGNKLLGAMEYKLLRQNERMENESN